jgi:hypothetical protein
MSIGPLALIAVIVLVGFLYVRGARRTSGGSPGEWADWAGDEARNLGTKAAEALRNRYNDEEED